MTTPIVVRGGAGGVSAHCDDMDTTARLFGRCAGDAASHVLSLHAYLVQPQILESVVFDPVGAARFEAELIAALDGPHGVTQLAARATALDLGLRAAAAAYRDVDQLSTTLAPAVDFLRDAPHAGWDAVGTLLTTGDVSAAVQRWLTDDPSATDLVAGLTAGAVGAVGMPQAAALLGRLYPDGSARVRSLGADAGADAPGPPRSLADLVGGLARRNLGRNGEIDVRVLTSAGGQRRVIVDIPGTKDWSPARHNADITSVSTNLRALAGTSTSYERGVEIAMARAGVRPEDDVLLVGHSEGGMVAANMAIHQARSRRYHISHVITAGAPIGSTAAHVPRTVQLLAIENRGDLVPHLDAAENPDRANVTTAVVNRDHRTIGDNHDLDESYVPGAADVDASTNRSSRAYLDGLRPFLAADTVQTQTFQVTRTYP